MGDLPFFSAHCLRWRTASTLLARLYPNVSAHADDKPVDLTHLLLLNAELRPADAAYQRIISVALGPVTDPEPGITVTASGWNVCVDRELADLQPLHRLAMLGVACMAAAEVFRDIFAKQLPVPPSGPQPGAFNIITCGPESSEVPPPTLGLDIGTVHLAGAGGIGQACVFGLRAAGVRGRLITVDRETLDLSNLQRYVLSTLNDVGRPKVDIIEDALPGLHLKSRRSRAAGAAT